MVGFCFILIFKYLFFVLFKCYLLFNGVVGDEDNFCFVDGLNMFLNMFMIEIIGTSQPKKFERE